MDLELLPFRSSPEQYQRQAQELLNGYETEAAGAMRCFRKYHPRFRHGEFPWLPLNAPDAEIQKAALGLADAQLTIARLHDFRDWAALAEYVAAVTQTNSDVERFESAAEAAVTGNIPALKSLLHNDPELTRARSRRITCFDPPNHHATLLHYMAANGVERCRQKTPKAAVEVAKILLQAGSDPDALADMYCARWNTLGLVVSSCHPAEAGLQVALLDTLLDFGASIGSSLMTALTFGYSAAAAALVRRGAPVDGLPVAAGLGQLGDARLLLATADQESRHRALSLAAQHGRTDIVEWLLEAGEDPNRYNPAGNHPHTTPLHQAALAGHESVVRTLVERGARLDIKDKIHQSTPLGWANHAGHGAIADYLRSRER